MLSRLAAGSDIVLEGWRPGVAGRLGADCATLSAANPDLVYCSISGFGQDGPWRDRPAHDIDFSALAGLLAAQAAISGRPWPPPVLASDVASGLYAAVAVLAALAGRGGDRGGRYIDLSMAESTLALLAPEIGRLGDGGSGGGPNVTFIPHYGVFECADGRWFTLGIVDEDHFWRRFCGAAGLDHLADLTLAERVDRGELLASEVREAFLSRTSDHWSRALTEADVPAAAVEELRDLPRFAPVPPPRCVRRHGLRDVPGPALQGLRAAGGARPRRARAGRARRRDPLGAGLRVGADRRAAAPRRARGQGGGPVTAAVPAGGYQVGDYAETYRTFRQEVPPRFNWACEVFDGWARDREKVAMVWLTPDGRMVREVTFREMAERSRRVANALTGLGARRGDRVLIMLSRVVEWWEIVLGCMRAGLVAVPGTTLLTEKDIAYRLGAAEPAVAITDVDNHDKVARAMGEMPRPLVVVGGQGHGTSYEALLAAASPDLPNPHNPSSDLMAVYFTSGTTGNPKMVAITHASYPIGHVATGRFWLDNRPTDLHWTLSDTGWAQAAWTAFFAPWNMGAAIFVWDQRGRFDPGEALGVLERFPITTFFAPPTAYRMMVQQDLSALRPRALRHAVGAGEALNPEVIDSWREGTGLHIWEGYGQTESTLMAATFPGMEHRPGSMGVRVPRLRSRGRRRGRARAPRGRGGRARGSDGAGPPRRAIPRVLARSRREQPGLPGRLVPDRRQGLARRGRIPVVRRTRGRPDNQRLVPHRAVRGRVRPGRAPPGRRGGGGGKARPGARPDRQGLRRRRGGGGCV